MSKIYSFKKVQLIPSSIDIVWNYFATPVNLIHITPKEMDFKLKSEFTSEKMYAGQLIEYTVKPLLGIPLYWMTEITHLEENKYFADEQRYGPYSLWHHEHHFKEVPGGVEMTDLVYYKIPYWFIGDIANALIVKKKLRKLFDYRYNRIQSIFGNWPTALDRQ